LPFEKNNFTNKVKVRFFYLKIGVYLKIIPVIDILNGVAVHAVRGKRKEYMPLKSALCPSSDPLMVASAFKTLGFTEFYLADLDAITGQTPNYKIIQQIADQTGLKLMVDAGVSNLIDAQKTLNCHASKVIIGTETLCTKAFVAQATQTLGSNRVIVSLDMKGPKILVKMGFDGGKNALCLLKDFEGMGVSEFILLDLSRVGSGEGVNVSFLKEAIQNLKAHIYVGGGVRDISDLAELKALGVEGVLLATALHEGKITVPELKKAGLLGF
jgi:phosphoribosylformimino-5-aminoimidazole carboxamide ribotide isomerase